MQFGHAGAQSRTTTETAAAKNAALAEVPSIHVPANFDTFGILIGKIFKELVDQKEIVPFEEPDVPVVPKDFKTLQKLGVVRPNPANIVCSISDDRGDEVSYGGMKLSRVMNEDLGIGGVISLLWFKRRLPYECTKFIEMILCVCADHGPAVSGAHNAIVCARAGKDVVDSLCSGLLTIGPRFGGALDGAVKSFTKAFDSAMTPAAYVKSMKQKNELILGIGHKIKSKHNPDTRVEILKKFALANWSKEGYTESVLGFALAVEEITIAKKANLILNVDGCIAGAFMDMLRNCGAFPVEEANRLVENGCLNGLFALARSIGIIGHVLDQKNMNQGLYRHPQIDIAYIEEKME
jgi:ATP citrate (pro-S)-lyase